MENFNFDHEFDVVVIGTGNGGLTSAICARDGGAPAGFRYVKE